jgi:hypothetical protein
MADQVTILVRELLVQNCNLARAFFIESFCALIATGSSLFSLVQMLQAEHSALPRRWKLVLTRHWTYYLQD